MSRLTGIVHWFGGKARLQKHILPLIPESHCYVEPFGGAASILCGLTPRPVEVYNDLDDRLVTLFRVLQNPRQAAALKRRLHSTPYSRAEFARALTEVNSDDPVSVAWGTFVSHNCGYAGMAARIGNWLRSKTTGQARAFRNRVERLDDWVERFRGVTIDNRPALKVLECYDSQNTVFYCDPPYVPDTRLSGTYRHEMDREAHEALVEKLLSLKGRVILSGYDSPLYRPLRRAKWTVQRFEVRCTAVAVKHRKNADTQRTEVVWISPE